MSEAPLQKYSRKKVDLAYYYLNSLKIASIATDADFLSKTKEMND
jgi:hypothetical protein